ncbi:MAG: low molecular weight protein-tyrosine-phosphatase, partial [Bacteroidota bacterium]
HVGERPDPRSVETARFHGIDISRQRARQFKAHDLDQFDLVLAMDSSNYRNIINLALTEDQKAKVELILNFAEPGRNGNVPDPYYGGDDGFEKVYQMLDRACKQLVARYSSDQ